MKRALVLFYFLVFYAVMQLGWWGYLLVSYEPERKGMIIGEGIFFCLFSFGGYASKKLFSREHKLQQQQQNFLLSVTHELKSPLASVKLYIQTILKRDLDREQQKMFLTNSLKDIERLDDLVENVLLTTKLESRSFNLPKEDFNFTEVINSVVDRLQKNACSSQVIKPELDQNVVIHADKFAITNVVNNLVENAIKYSPPCANVVVQLKKSELGKLTFSVADHGQGIPEEEKKNVFNKFYRVGNESTRKTKGTGLGLYIVKTVLQKHNASIKVKDNTPSGSIFEVTFENYAS